MILGNIPVPFGHKGRMLNDYKTSFNSNFGRKHLKVHFINTLKTNIKLCSSLCYSRNLSYTTISHLNFFKTMTTAGTIKLNNF